ncbi:MAG: hypothetical protein KDA75_04030 [Planctomycetaceae bacterium]|nr:hypothetical protein [Planctomycetaceae bacterium]
MSKVVSRYCRRCKRYVPAIQGGANHVLHLLLAIVTAGMWIPVWFLASASGDPICPECGRPIRSRLMIAMLLFLLCFGGLLYYGYQKGN